MLQRTEGRPGGCGGQEPPALGPWQSCHLPGLRLLVKGFSAPPPLTAVSSQGFPIRVAVSLSPPGSYLSSSSKPRVLALSSQGSGTSALAWEQSYFRPQFFLRANPPPPPTFAPNRTSSLFSPSYHSQHPTTQTCPPEPQMSIQQKAPQNRFLLKSQKIGPSLFFLLLFLFFSRSCKSGCYI